MKVLINTAKLCLLTVVALGLGHSITWADNGFTLEAGDIVIEDGKIQTNKICDKDGNNCKDISNISSSHTHPYSSSSHTHPYSSNTHTHSYISECRVCFKETEGSSQCQGKRSSCSGWSKNPSWTEAFRDDTDKRSGGCKYQWKMECR